MKKGFTLIETILTIMIFTTIFAMAVASFVSFQKRGVLESQAEQITAIIRDSRAKASSGETEGEEQIYFGVLIEGNSVDQFATLTDYANRITSWDLETQLPDSLNFTLVDLPNTCKQSNDCVVFAPIVATPSGSGTVVIGDQGGASKTININSVGKVSYE